MGSCESFVRSRGHVVLVAAGLALSAGGRGTTGTALATGGKAAASKENLDLPYDAVGDTDGPGDQVVNISFLGQTFEGEAFFYVIDRSSTMEASGKLLDAKRQVLQNIAEFSEHVEFGIFFFDKSVSQYPQSGQPSEATPAARASATAWVQATEGGHGTCCQAALTAAIRMANRSSAKRKTIIYLSDGGGTCPGSDDEEAYLRQTISAVSAQNWQRVQVNTIGVLTIGPLQESFLRNLAATNGGSYTRLR